MVKAYTNLGTNESNTFIAFNSELIRDMNNNSVVPISEENALQTVRLYPDFTPPEIVSFRLDLTLELLHVTFSETIMASSTNIPEFAIQGSQSRVDYRQLQNSTHSELDSTVLVISLGIEDLNELKRLTSVATSVNNTYLTATGSAIRDMNNNSLVPIQPSMALVASNFTPDSIAPELIGFNLNLSSEILTLFFSETVRASTHTVSLYTLQSSGSLANSVQYYPLTGGISQPDDSHVIEVELTTADLNEIKRLVYLAIRGDNTYLTVESAAIFDMNGLPLVSVPDESALPVSIFEDDLIDPELSSFNLDMNIGLLTLLFSETVRISTFDITQINLQDMETSIDTYTLTNNSFTNSSDSAIVVVQLHPIDLNEIKRLYTLAIDNSSTYISFISDLVDDMNNNSIVPISSDRAQLVSIFVSDQTPPSLETFNLNLNSSELQLFFSETVNRESLDVESITIQNRDILLGSLQLSTSSSSSSPNDTYIVVDIGLVDLNNLKRLTEVATSNDTTYLSLNSTAISDMNDNAVVQIPGFMALQVTNFIQDAIRPVLQGFNLDIDAGVLTLFFSETVNASSLNVSAITLQSSLTFVAEESYRLQDGSPPDLSYTNSSNGPILIVIIGSTDLNEIKANYDLANSNMTAFLSLAEYAVRDMVGLRNEPILNDTARLVTEFTEDTSVVVLLGFTLNLTTEEVILTFDETVNVGSFVVSELTLHSAQNITNGTFIELTVVRFISMVNSTEVAFTLGQDDLNDIKLDTELGTNINNTYLTITSQAVQDMALEPNSVMPSTLQAEMFEPDLVQPRLLSFAVDMNIGVLTLYFDEPVNASSLEPTAFSLHSTRNESIVTVVNATNSTAGNESITTYPTISTYTLTGGFTNSTNGLQIRLYFTDDDLNAIKEDEILFTNNLTSFLTVESFAVTDMNYNMLTEINSFEALQASVYVNDTTPPLLLGFDLDMNMGILTLSFVETVNVTSTMFDGIILQRSSNVLLSTNMYMLTGGELTMSENGLVAVIKISQKDLNEIKRRRIALTANTTWLAIEEATLLDMSDRPLQPLVNGLNTIMVSNYTTDTTPPKLESFIFDLDASILTLSFSETVVTRTMNVTSITLQDTADGSNAFSHVSLTNSSYVNSTSRDIVIISIGLDDLNSIKQEPELATSTNNTFISFYNDLVEDVFGNNILTVAQNESIKAIGFTPDVTPPELESFDLNMHTRVLTLRFSETVNASSLLVAGISLVSDPSILESYQLQTSSPVLMNGPVVDILISSDDFNSIKTMERLATGPNDTFLILQSFALVDMSGNPVVNITESMPLRVTEYTTDRAPPVLVSFDLDMDGVVLTLTFSETVNVSSIEYTEITIINPDTPYLSYTFLRGETSSSVGTEIVITVTKDDEDNLKRIENLATNANNTYLIISSRLITDMDDNSVVNITVANPLQVANFTADTTPPTLLSFDLNLNVNNLTLVFSETVNASSLDIMGITFENEAIFDSNTTTNYTLTDSIVLPVYNDPSVTVWLSRSDRDGLKELTDLAADEDTTYIVIVEGVIRDMVDVSSLPINETEAQMVRLYTKDMTSPDLERFSLDLSTEILALNFSEPILLGSIDVSELTFHNKAQRPTSLYALSGGIVLNEHHSSYLEISLTTSDLNAIKVATTLATDNTNTYITFTMAFSQDTALNFVTAQTDPLPADQFTADSIKPRLLSFNLDLSSEVLTLFFSESVNANSLALPSIRLLPSHNNSIGEFVFTSSSYTDSLNGDVISVNISVSDLDRLKAIQYIAINEATTFLALSDSAVVDMNNNSIVPILSNASQPVAMYTRDNIEPELLSFQLNLNEETLILSFSETVNVSSLIIEDILIQSMATSASSSVALTGAVYVSAENDPIVQISLTRENLDEIKSKTDLASSLNDTFLSLSGSAIRDMFNNSVIAIPADNALQVLVYTPDVTQPELSSYSLDIDAGHLILSFSESVAASTFDPSSITLQSDAVEGNSTSTYTLRDFPVGNLEIVDSVSTMLLFRFSVSDLNSIKAIVTLATFDNDTFLSLESSAVKDQALNNITAIPQSRALLVNNFTGDTTCPELSSVSLDLNSGILSLAFYEPVNTSTLDPTMVSIYNSIAFGEHYTLTEATFARMLYVTNVLLTLSDYDLDLIKANINLGRTTVDTFAYLTELAVTDSAMNFYCNDTTPFQVSNVTFDTTPPQLLNFTLDLTREVLLLTFSETVQLQLDVSAITIQAQSDDVIISSASGSMSGSGSGSGMGTMLEDPIPMYTLTRGVSSINYTTAPHVVVLELDDGDLNNIKALPELAVSLMTTNLAVTSQLTRDYGQIANDIVAIPPYATLQAGAFIRDAIPPEVLSISLDMNTAVLVLTLSEIVNISSFDVTQLIVQSSPSITNSEYYQLQSSNAVLGDVLTQVRVYLSREDTNNIKQIPGLATSTDNTYISFTSDLVRDTFQNRIIAVDNATAMDLAGYSGDVSPPVLVAFNLSLTSEILTLSFDETVNANSLLPTRIELSSDLARSNAVPLTSGRVISSMYSTVIEIALSDEDLHNIKRNLELATITNNTCLTMFAMGVFDLSADPTGNLETSLCATSFTPDFVDPQLTSFAVNLNNEILILNFDEPIDIDSMNLTFVTLQSDRTVESSTQQVPLTGGRVTSVNLLQVTVNLTIDDLNVIKQNLRLLRGPGTGSSFLRLEAEFVTDLNNNSIVPINESLALQASLFIDDTINPVLDTFDLDMNTGDLTLHFSETVNVRTLDITQITLQVDSEVGQPDEQHTLQVAMISSRNGPDITIRISNDDLNVLKTRSIGRTNNTAWIVLTNDTVMDITGQPVIPVMNEVNSIPVDVYTQDTTSPELLSFSLDLTNDILILSFSESVHTSTLLTTQITITSGAANLTDELIYTLTEGISSVSGDVPEISFILSRSDLNELKQRTRLAVSNTTTFISVTSLTINDTFGNPVEEIPLTDALPVTTFTDDRTQPIFEGL